MIPDLSRVRPAWILLAALTLGGCEPGAGGQEPESGDSPPVVDVTMVDYAFVAPDTIPSGWVTLRTTNEGEESHHFHLYRLPEDRTYEDYREERLVPRDSIMRALAAGTMDTARAREVYNRTVSDWTRSANMEMKGGAGLLAPGRTGETTLRLEPGEYVINCSVQTSGGRRHWQLGMVRPITVSATSTEASPPVADVTLRVSGRELIPEGRLTAGTQTVRFVVDRVAEGVEDSVFYAWLARLDGDTGADDLLEWETRGPAPAEYLGGFWYIPVDRSAYVTVDLTPGRYAWDWGYFGVEHSGVEFTVE